ncbi:MAG: protoporphyrinogen oxidase [Chloroflexi bacterium]|nr:protoporphyrinogen oxidase [Chloroflexota bacterium]MCC6891178.1 protoporphyrinogen oxidase [Anaerolineae bacterium]
MNIPPSNRPASPHTFHVVIIGGGIAGLSTAWYLQQAARDQSIDLQYTIIEASDRWGGKVQTEYVDSDGDSSFVLEAGPDAFLTRKAGVVNLVRELGLEERVISVNQVRHQTYVVNKGQLVPLPEGMQLLVPTRLRPFLRSPLFSRWGKLRVGLDWFIPKRTSKTDESLAHFVRRRLGTEVLDKLAEPLLSGVYNAEPENQSMQATFSQFPAMEQKYGSLLRGAKSTQANLSPERKSAFISFQQGACELVAALVSHLSGCLRLSTPVETVMKSGRNYRVRLATGEELIADAVVLATPAKVAALLTKQGFSQTATQLETIPYSSIGAVYLGFRKSDVQRVLDGFGVVIPRSEKRKIDGITWVSSKWTSRAPSDSVLLRVFFGGPNTRDMMRLSDDNLLDVIRSEVRSLLGIHVLPIFHRVFRWPEGYPQYEVGHLDRIAAIEAALPHGLYVTGSSYRGIGVPDCITQGQNTASQVIADLLERKSEASPLSV